MKRILLILLLLLAPAALAPNAFAIDGQVLINQASVTAAGGFPYKITQPGSYKLSGNLVGTLNTPVIQIASSNVILDLNGFNVRCNYAVPTGFGFPTCITDGQAALTGITIRNGTITAAATAPQFNVGQNITGLSLQGSNGSTVEKVHFTSESTNFSVNGLATGAYFIIRDNTFSNGASPGVGCPSLVENNVNQTVGAGASGTGCKYVNNVGLFPNL